MFLLTSQSLPELRSPDRAGARHSPDAAEFFTTLIPQSGSLRTRDFKRREALGDSL